MMMSRGAAAAVAGVAARRGDACAAFRRSKSARSLPIVAAPIERLYDTAEGAALLRRCHEQLEQQGFVAIRGFLSEDAAGALLDEARALERDGNGSEGFFSTEEHGIFLTADDAVASCQVAGAAAQHPRRIQQKSSKHLFAADEVAENSLLRALYEWPPLLEFVRAALDRPNLHLSADPMGRFYLNFFRPGDQLGWHFDNSEFSVSLILQPSIRGGAFEFAPRSRGAVEAMQAFAPEDLPEMRSPPLAMGDLYLFHGRDALHRVAPVEEGVRINAILTFNSDPDEVMNEYTREKFFGRRLDGAK